MVLVVGISALSLSPGAVVKAQVLSSEDESFTQTFSIPIHFPPSSSIEPGSELQPDFISTFRTLASLITQRCTTVGGGEIKHTSLCLPLWVWHSCSTAQRELIKRSAEQASFSPLRIVRNTALVHSNSLSVDEHPAQNHICVEVGEKDVMSRLYVVEAEDEMMFYGDAGNYENVLPALKDVDDMESVQPERLYDQIIQPLLDKLAEEPTEAGSEVRKVVVVDSSESTNHPTIAFRLFRLIRERFLQPQPQQPVLTTDFVYDDKLLSHCARAALDLYTQSLQPFNGCIFNVLPYHIGIAKSDGFVHRMLHRNRTIPTVAEAVFTTLRDNQTSVRIRVVLGFSQRVERCKTACELLLDGLSPKPRGQVLIRIRIDINVNDEMSVFAEEVIATVNAFGYNSQLVPLVGGATTRKDMQTYCGDAEMDAGKIERLLDESEGISVEEKERKEKEAQRAERVWNGMRAVGALLDSEAL